MSKKEVQKILGPPTYIEDKTFNGTGIEQLWHYGYYDESTFVAIGEPLVFIYEILC